jgi:cytoskeletal protein RodZ
MGIKKSRRQKNREFWRTIFIWTIGLSIPCYVLAFFVYAFVPRQADRINPTNAPTVTWTPIDPNNAVLTQRASTNSAPTSLFASRTPFDNFTLQPPSQFTQINIFTSTPAPTRFITLTPSITPNATATPQPTIAQPTAIPTDPPPILLPPSDTPNP